MKEENLRVGISKILFNIKGFLGYLCSWGLWGHRRVSVSRGLPPSTTLDIEAVVFLLFLGPPKKKSLYSCKVVYKVLHNLLSTYFLPGRL